MKRLTSLILLTALLLPNAALAQEVKPVDAIPPGDDVIVVLPKGQAAPFEGQLFDNFTAMRWANWLRQYKLRLRVDVQEQKDICRVRTDAAQQLLISEQQKYSSVTHAYELRIAEIQRTNENPPWYQTPAFYMGTGAVGTALIFVGGILLVGAAQK